MQIAAQIAESHHSAQHGQIKLACEEMAIPLDRSVHCVYTVYIENIQMRGRREHG